MTAAYLLRRLAGALAVIVGVILATFLLLHLVPGDPARAALGEHATPTAVAALRHKWGLDRSLADQLGTYLSQLGHLNLGQSLYYSAPTGSLIWHRIGITASLVGVVVLFAVVITVPLAVLAARRPGSATDQVVRAVPLVGLGMPSFWIGIVASEVFGVALHILPVGGWGSSVPDHLRSLVLPGLTAALAITPILVRSLRVGMIDILDADFVAVVRSKGIREARLLVVHVVRNAAVPTVTLLGLNIAYLIGTTVIIERVFALGGVGDLMLTTVSNRDYPVVQGVTLVLAVAVVLINLGTDLAMAALDPPLATPTMSQHPLDQPVLLSPRAGDQLGPEWRPGPTGPWSRARQSRALLAGSAITSALVLAALLAPELSPDNPQSQDLTHILAGPSGAHWLGTDELGRDVLSRMLYAARTDLRVGFLAILIPFAVGTTLGLACALYRGWLDAIVMRVVDVVLAFPFYVLVIALVFVFGTGTRGIYVAIALVDWVAYARTVRSATLALADSDFVAAARGGGIGEPRVILRHVLPNVVTQAIVYAMSDIVLVIVAVVTLGYLGLGVQPPTPDWGTMISDGQQFLTTDWALATIPGLGVVLTGLGLSLLGDGLADVLRAQ